MYTFARDLNVELWNSELVIFFLQWFVISFLQSRLIAILQSWLRLRMQKRPVCAPESWETISNSCFAVAVWIISSFQDGAGPLVRPRLSCHRWIICISDLYRFLFTLISVIQWNSLVFLMLWLITRIKSLGCTNVSLMLILSFQVHSVEVALETMSYLWKIVTWFT
jgi:hypothetical protein